MNEEETEAQCWREFWEIVGAEAYRLWAEGHAPAEGGEEAA